MKIKKLLITFLCFCVLILSGCDDNSNLVGNSFIPDSDMITIYTDTIQIQATTIIRDSLFSKTINGILGEYFDPLYGRLKADYLCQFYCQDDYQFQNTPYNNSIDSIFMTLYYLETGDPNTPFQFQIFPVTKPLDKVYYSNVNPADYADLNTIWASKVYTAADGLIYDSVQVTVDSNKYYRSLQIPLPYELGQKIYEETVNNPASFKTQQAFNEFFPGMYITTGYGSGCLFNIVRSDIFIHYKSTIESSVGEDSIVHMAERFITTKEVIQLNRFENSGTEQLLTENDDYTFIKTPAGVYTRLYFPIQDIKSKIENRFINSMMFSLKYMPNENWPYALGPPSHLLLLPEDSLISFFQGRSVENNITSFISVNSQYITPELTEVGYSADNRTFYFNNIATLLSYHLFKSPDEDLRLLVVPVYRETSTINNYLYTTDIYNYLAPSGLKLRKDKDLMKVSIVTSKFNNK